MTNSFQIYYKEKFRGDLIQFFNTIPDQSKYHESSDKSIFSIQYERLTRDFDHFSFINDKEDLVNFGISLFVTVLVDEVCFCHYKTFYYEFAALTRYPKFIGNCPGGCHYHLHPTDIFSAMNSSRKKHGGFDILNFKNHFIAAIPVMHEEVTTFFKIHMSLIDPNEFWSKCYNELPYKSFIG